MRTLDGATAGHKSDLSSGTFPMAESAFYLCCDQCIVELNKQSY